MKNLKNFISLFNVETFLDLSKNDFIFHENCQELYTFFNKKNIKTFYLKNKTITINNKYLFLKNLILKLSPNQNVILYLYLSKYINRHSDLIDIFKYDYDIQKYLHIYIICNTTDFNINILNNYSIKNDQIKNKINQLKNIWNPSLIFENTLLAKKFWEILEKTYLSNTFNCCNNTIGFFYINELFDILNILLNFSVNELNWKNLKYITSNNMYTFLIHNTYQKKLYILYNHEQKNILHRFRSIYHQYYK